MTAVLLPFGVEVISTVSIHQTRSFSHRSVRAVLRCSAFRLNGMQAMPRPRSAEVASHGPGRLGVYRDEKLDTRRRAISAVRQMWRYCIDGVRNVSKACCGLQVRHLAKTAQRLSGSIQGGRCCKDDACFAAVASITSVEGLGLGGRPKTYSTASCSNWGLR